jgi:hypothetical protein
VAVLAGKTILQSRPVRHTRLLWAASEEIPISSITPPLPERLLQVVAELTLVMVVATVAITSMAAAARVDMQETAGKAARAS